MGKSELDKVNKLINDIESGKVDADSICIKDKSKVIEMLDKLIKDEESAINDYQRALNKFVTRLGFFDKHYESQIAKSFADVTADIRDDEIDHKTTLIKLHNIVAYNLKECK